MRTAAERQHAHMSTEGMEAPEFTNDFPGMSEEQARGLLAEATKLAKPGMLGFGGRKYDEAADTCKKAANIYKMLKKGPRSSAHFRTRYGSRAHTRTHLARRFRSLHQWPQSLMQAPRRATRS